MQYKEMFEQFVEFHLPEVVATYGEDDQCAIDQAWNDYTDSICKEGNITELEYHYCPAFDSVIPENNLEHVLNEMGVSVESVAVSHRDDGLMNDMPHHWEFTINRNGIEFTGYFSGGSKITNSDPLTVLECVFMEYVDPDSTFSEWCDELGYSDDSIKALKTYDLCKSQSAALREMFTDNEREQLSEMFQDY